MAENVNIIDEGDEDREELNNEEQSDDSNDENVVNASSIESGGTAIEIIEDGKGNKWAIPLDQNEDFDDLHKPDFDPVSEHFRKEGFWAQTIRLDQLDEYLGKGFVPITRDEMDLPPHDRREYGIPVQNALTKGPDIWVKIPMKLKEQMDARYHRRVVKDRDALKATEEMMKGSSPDFPVKVKHSRKNYGEIEDALTKSLKR